jgi:hypothetical protein
MHVSEIRRTIVVFVLLCLQFPALNGQQSHYEPSLESLIAILFPNGMPMPS